MEKGFWKRAFGKGLLEEGLWKRAGLLEEGLCKRAFGRGLLEEGIWKRAFGKGLLCPAFDIYGLTTLSVTRSIPQMVRSLG